MVSQLVTWTSIKVFFPKLDLTQCHLSCIAIYKATVVVRQCVCGCLHLCIRCLSVSSLSAKTVIVSSRKKRRLPACDKKLITIDATKWHRVFCGITVYSLYLVSKTDVVGKGGTSDVKRYNALTGVNDLHSNFSLHLAMDRSTRHTDYTANTPRPNKPVNWVCMQS